MTNWKRAVVIGSFSAAALLLLNGRKGPAAAIAGVGAAILATEYPDKFERLWEEAPDYIYKGTQIMNAISRMAERFAEQRGLTDNEAESGYVT